MRDRIRDRPHNAMWAVLVRLAGMKMGRSLKKLQLWGIVAQEEQDSRLSCAT